MDFAMFPALFTLILTTITVNNIQAFQLRSNLAPLQDDENIGPLDEQIPQTEIDQRRAMLQNIKDNLHDFVLGVASSTQSKNPKEDNIMASRTSSPALHKAFRQTLHARGMPKSEVTEILKEVENRILSRLSRSRKRGWNRFSVQTRFAPFGTKLVPNRKLENGGATLLRYGRSSSTH